MGWSDVVRWRLASINQRCHCASVTSVPSSWPGVSGPITSSTSWATVERGQARSLLDVARRLLLRRELGAKRAAGFIGVGIRLNGPLHLRPLHQIVLVDDGKGRGGACSRHLGWFGQPHPDRGLELVRQAAQAFRQKMERGFGLLELLLRLGVV